MSISRSRLLRRLITGPGLGATLTVALLGTMTTPSAEAAEPNAGDATAIQLRLSRPTGPNRVGTTELHLVDRDRADPWLANGQPRELMVSVFYPASPAGEPYAPYMRSGAAAEFDRGASEILGLATGQVDWAGVETYAFDGAAADTRGGRRPVVLFSPGFWNERTVGTTLAAELASQGYVVVTIDHTYEAHAVQFPDGRVATPRIAETEDPAALQRAALPVRVRDTRFVLDQLGVLAGGGNPDAERRRLPPGLSRLLDLSRVGAFGHSAGGVTAAETMYEDRRVDVGVDLDGPLGYDWTSTDQLTPVAEHGLDRPLLLIGARLPDGSPQNHHTSPSWGSFWAHSTGARLDLSVPAAAHNSFTDYQLLVPQLAERVNLPAGLREGLIGTIDPARAMATQRAYVVAFFDQYLRNRPQPLLRAPSPHYPEITFVR